MSGERPDVSVVLPVYRNAATLDELHRRLSAVLEDAAGGHELVFVCDACPAGSLPVLEKIAAADPAAKVVPLDRNVGQHRAVLAGIAAARGETIAVMDADLQDPPEALPRLLDALDDDVEAVFAGRRGSYQSPGRHLTSRVFKALLHRLAGVPPDAGMYFVMTRRLADRVLAIPARRPFVVALIGSTGAPTTSIPVTRSPRPRGRSAYRPWDRLRVALQALAFAARQRLR